MIPRIIWSWYTGPWRVACYVWYSQETVTIHTSTVRAPITILFLRCPPPSPLLWAMACHDGNGYNCTYSMLTEIWSSVVLESIGRICQLPAPPMCSSKWWKSRKLARWPTLRTVIFSWAHLEYKCRSIATPTWLVASSKTTLSTPKYNINNTAEDPMLWYSRV